MPLTLTITDPSNLTEAERMAVLTFCEIRVEKRDPEKIARSEPRDSVREMMQTIYVDQGPGEVPTATAKKIAAKIAEADNPATGATFIPPVPTLLIGNDPAKIFGGASTPSVPLPPSPAAPVVPSAASAIPPVSVPSAGASDAPAAPPNPTNALDSAGMPWDHRIHATTKTKNADGTWRQKRGVDGAMIAEVTEQNKRLIAIPAPIVSIMPAPTGMTFAELMDQVVKLINNGKLSLESANAACVPMGVTHLHQLDKRPDLIDAAWGRLRTAAGVA